MTSFTLVRRIAARPSVLFDALIAPDAIRQWWGPDAGPVLLAETEPRIGGRFRVRFRMLDGSEHECSGEYLEFDPPHRLVMSWRWLTGGGDAGESRVEISLRPIDDGTGTGRHADPGQDPRGAPDPTPLWNILDLTPAGRGSDWYPKLDYGG